MPAASILIKPASSNCNIDCRYCFYKSLSNNREQYGLGFMTYETLEILVREAIAYADNYLVFAFQGGEPTLAGLSFFRKAVALQQQYNDKGLIIENTIQTNGLLFDEEWAEFLAENKFLVGLSLDGPKKVHDRYRKDMIGGGTFEKVINTVKLLGRFNVDYNIVSVVTREVTKQAAYLYKFYRRNNFRFVQLIPCIDETVRYNMGDGWQGYAINSEDYGKFLNEIFDLWYDDFINGNGMNMDIRMFSNLAQMAAGYPAEQCGMDGRCNCYFVVEGNGNVYPCDFYCMDTWKLGTVAEGFARLGKKTKAREFVKESFRVEPDCKSCKYFALCRGGCRRWREDGTDRLGINVLCSAYKIFFEHTWERLHKLGKIIVEHYGVYQERDREMLLKD